MGSYREHALEGAAAVDLVVALYDGIIRFLYAAITAAERGDADARRAAVKRALDIIIHLQARLRMDVGGRPAQALSEFYAAIFAQILQASQAASKTQIPARDRLCSQRARCLAGSRPRSQRQLRFAARAHPAAAPRSSRPGRYRLRLQLDRVTSAIPRALVNRSGCLALATLLLLGWGWLTCRLAEPQRLTPLTSSTPLP